MQCDRVASRCHPLPSRANPGGPRNSLHRWWIPAPTQPNPSALQLLRYKGTDNCACLWTLTSLYCAHVNAWPGLLPSQQRARGVINCNKASRVANRSNGSWSCLFFPAHAPPAGRRADDMGAVLGMSAPRSARPVHATNYGVVVVVVRHRRSGLRARARPVEPAGATLAARIERA